MAFQDPNSDAGQAVGIGKAIGLGLGDLALSEGLNGLHTAMQYTNQKRLNRQAQRDTQQNMKLQQQLNLESQYKSIANSTSAYRAAGLNPMLAAGAPVAQGVGVAGGSAGEAAMPAPADVNAAITAGINLDMLAEQKSNLQANTELQIQEAREKKIENDRKVSEDSLVGQNLPVLLAKMRDSTDSPFIRGFIDQFEDSLTGNDVNLGQLNAFSKLFFDFSQRERDRELDFIAKEMDKKVLSMQYDNGTAEALADMSKANRLQIYRNIALMQAQIGQLESETSLTEDKRAAIRASVAKLGQEVQSLLHHDPAAMWKAGDISGLLVSLGYDGIKAAATGAGYGAAMYATRGAGVPKGAVTAGTSSKLGSASLRTSVSPSGKPVPPDVLKSIRSAAAARANGNKVYEAQLFNASVRRWKAQNGY